MIDLAAIYSVLRDCRVEFITGVPDTLLNDFCLSLTFEWKVGRHVIAANEGNAIALAAGYHLATGTVPLVYMQNSGIGNAINPLVSLVDSAVYAIPMVLMIGWRGEPGSSDWPQHQRQGEISPLLLDILKIPYQILDTDQQKTLEAIQWAVQSAREMSQPTALLVRKGVLAKSEKAGFDITSESYSMNREEAIRTILSAAPADAIFVASTGRITRELHAIRADLNQKHDRDFLNVGAMGHALSIAAGIASAQPHQHVICLDGDGAAIMHLGSLAVTAQLSLNNLYHIILNNGVHESVGGQETVGYSVDLTSAARAIGYKTHNQHISTKDGLVRSITRMTSEQGPCFLDVHIKQGIRSDLPRLVFNAIDFKNRLMSQLKNNNNDA